MPKTCLALAQDFCGSTALAKPTAIFSSNDDGFIQLAALMNEGLDDLTTRHTWGVLQQEALVTSVAAESQGLIPTLCPAGYLNIVRNQIWDRTTNLALNGPVSSTQWQAMHASASGGPLYNWRIRQNALLVYPVMPAGHTLAFEYASNYAVQSSTGVAQAAFIADTDIFLLPDRLMAAWLRWRWKAEKGLMYTEEFRLYETLVAQAASTDNEGRVLDLDVSEHSGPGLFVPSGTWFPSV